MSDKWIDRYRLVMGTGAKTVSDEVNGILGRGLGWQPYGGPVVDGDLVIQAMVQYEKED